MINERFDYHGENGLMARCRVRVYGIKGQAPVVIASKYDNNPGQSITNAGEVLWLQNPGRVGKWGQSQADTFDRITFANWRSRIKHLTAGTFVTFGEPEWNHLVETAFAELAGDWE